MKKNLDKKSVIIEHLKTSRKLSKTVRQAENVSQVGSNISLYSDENESFKRCLVRYLHTADHNPRRITKADKGFATKPNFKSQRYRQN